MTESPSPTLVDARGHRCPAPTLRLRRAMETTPPGGLVTLLADDPMARVDVPHFARQAGFELVETREEGRAIAFTVRRPVPPAAG
ncbi:sulfurtransferase TusA family protein [Caulobacter sp. 17J65-9]|uniref:sulfurtransferase TusA family protein n=1 Tax=Caulobacter sp. 17J65-9 TaxID=2709382 RepID=UPI0013C596A5|nr:sulfurtransferase TusA family protein [Caulobacter sp. 17J65-9]